MILKMIMTVVAMLIVFIAIIANRPSEFKVERSVVVRAPSDAVFPLLNDFHMWNRWSPWEKLDPNMQRTFSGASAGPGSMYSWSGNSKAGEGRMTLEQSKSGEFVSIKLEFIKPMKATDQTTFELSPVTNGTMVSWTMTGKHNFVGKAFSLFMNMDKMVGKDFEKGLANLKVEAQVDARK